MLHWWEGGKVGRAVLPMNLQKVRVATCWNPKPWKNGWVLLCLQWNRKSGFPTWRNHLFFNPKGIASLSPALARFPEGLRWVAIGGRNTLKGFHVSVLHRDETLSGFVISPSRSPWVARSSQPRADRFNPFGIDSPAKTVSGFPPKTARNQWLFLTTSVIGSGAQWEKLFMRNLFPPRRARSARPTIHD